STIIWMAEATSFVRLLKSDQRRATGSTLVNLARGRTVLLRSLADLPGVYEITCDPPAHGLRITFGNRAIIGLGFVAPGPRCLFRRYQSHLRPPTPPKGTRIRPPSSRLPS